MPKYFLFFSGLFLLFLTACAGRVNPFAGDSTGFLPESGEISGLTAAGKRMIYFSSRDKEKYLGKDRAQFFNQHGLRSIYTRDYTFGGLPLTLESFQLDNDNGASGIYYYYAGRQLRGAGKEVSIGAQAVIDTLHQSRNLYFYKGRWFFSIIYTGKETAPDLQELARFLAARIPGESKRPDGFQFLEVEGVGHKYAKITSGNALNFDIFPPGVYAPAPAAGARAMVYVIDRGDKKKAEDCTRNFQRYLQVNAADYRSDRRVFGKNSVVFHQAKDARCGKVAAAFYEHYVLVIANLDEYSAGVEVLSRIVEQIRAAKGGAGK